MTTARGQARLPGKYNFVFFLAVSKICQVLCVLKTFADKLPPQITIAIASYCIDSQGIAKRAGKIAQLFRVRAALPNDLGSLPRTSIDNS